LNLVIEKRLGVDPVPSAVFDIVSSLHLSDLYLTLACAQASEVARQRFVSLYDKSIRKLCKFVCASRDAATEQWAIVAIVERFNGRNELLTWPRKRCAEEMRVLR